MKDWHKEKLEAMLYGLKEARSMFLAPELDDTIFRVERKLKEACPDCGRKASVCANTLSKCNTSPKAEKS